ncbi:MAG: hypothetical protein HYU99_10085 [Deltaproteobacteria bacterium]|nr:hypothetical protein [Deltaproteobacteria bacterium]
MPRKIIVVVILVLVILSWVGFQYKQKNLCRGKYATLECLKKNLDRVYLDDVKHGTENFAILGIAEKEALECRSIRKTADYLELAKSPTSIVEFREGFDEAIEDLFLENSRCFLEAYLLLDPPSREALTQYIVTRNIVDIVRQEASKYADDPRFKDFVQAILNTN